MDDSIGCKNGNRKAINEAKKKRNEYEFIDGTYITPSEAKIRRKTKKSKGGKNIQKSMLEQLLIITPKQKKNVNRTTPKIKEVVNNIYGYSELEEILKADNSIIDDPDRGILEWADSVLNPDEIFTFADGLSSDIEEDDDKEVEEIVLSDSSDEVQFIPTKAQNRVGICPKCSSTQKLVNFVWECDCSKKKNPSKRDISDNFYNIVADWDKVNPQRDTVRLTGNPSNAKRNGNVKHSYAAAARGKIYEKKKVCRGRNINLLTNQLEAVTLNEAMPSSSHLKKKKQPIRRSLLEDETTWGLSNSTNYTPSTFYDLIHESESPSADADKLGWSTSKLTTANDSPLLRGLLKQTSPSFSVSRSSRQTYLASESPSTSEVNTLKSELEQEKLHRMAMEAKVEALEMKFSQCLTLLEDTLPTLTARLNNISLTSDHISLIRETAKVEKQSAMKELNEAKKRILQLESQQASLQQKFKNKDLAKIHETTVTQLKNNSEIAEVTKEALAKEFKAKNNDDDDNDSEYSFVY